MLWEVSERTIQERLQKDLKMPSQSPVKKQLLTIWMKKQPLLFAKKYKDWSVDQWKKVMW